MPRPRSAPGGRPVVVAVRLSTAEAADLDKRRGSLSRGEWLRYLLLLARKQGTQMPEVPEIRWRNTVQ